MRKEHFRKPSELHRDVVLTGLGDVVDHLSTMLTNQLRALEADGLVNRKVCAEVPPRVEYPASKDGLALAPVFRSMHDWWFNRLSGT